VGSFVDLKLSTWFGRCGTLGMAEEIEWLDEELANLTVELGEKIKEITSAAGKKLGRSAREDRVRVCVRACLRACLRAWGPPGERRGGLCMHIDRTARAPCAPPRARAPRHPSSGRPCCWRSRRCARRLGVECESPNTAPPGRSGSCAHALLSRRHARRPGHLARGLWGGSPPFCALFRGRATAARGEGNL